MSLIVKHATTPKATTWFSFKPFLLILGTLVLLGFSGCETTSAGRYVEPESGPTASLSIFNGGFRVFNAYQTQSLESGEGLALSPRRIPREQAVAFTIPAGQPFFYSLSYGQGAGTGTATTTFALNEVEAGAEYVVFAGPSETAGIQTFAQRNVENGEDEVLEFGDKFIVGNTWKD